MYDLIIRDATIITSEGRLVADIAVEDGRIAHVGASALGDAREEVQGIGRFVIPGVIDTQVRMRTPGAADGPEWARNSRSAVTGGVTTIFDLPDAGPGTTSHAALRAKLDQAASESVCNYGLWVGASADNLESLWEWVEAGLAIAPYARLDRTTGPLGIGLEGLDGLAAAAGERLVGVYAEDPSAFTTGADGSEVRPPEAAAARVEQLLALSRAHDARLHITSLSTAAELNLLDPHRGDLPITTAVAPPHLFLSEQLVGKLDGATHVHPPIRPELDRRGLWAAIKRGRIDVAASDHTPIDRATNTAGQAGMPGVGLLFPMLMSAVRHGRMPLERVVEMCCEAPARIFGLKGKGRIEVGAHADLVLMTEGDTERLKGPPAWATVDWSPFKGRDAGVAPKLVVVGGRIVAREGALMDDLAPGQAVSAG